VYFKAMRLSALAFHRLAVRGTLLIFFFLSLSSPVLADKHESQVQLETKFVEVNHSQTRDLGVDFNHENNLDEANMRSLNRVGQPVNSGQPGNAFDFNPFDLSQNPSTPVPILGEPKIQTQNNEQATIATPGQIPVTPIVQDSGINLSVIPQIQPDGTINMVVTPQTVSGITQIKDGNSVVVGGLMQTEPPKENTEVPVIGKIPFLGHLFGNKSKESEKKNLTVFVTPTIVQHSDDN